MKGRISILTLDIPTEPYWLDLPRGVRVEIRPVTTAVMAAAQAGSARRLGALRAVEADLDPDMARGLAFAFLVKACVDGPRASRAVDDNLMQRVACGHVSGLLCGQHDRWP
jgi:hypothetical protein